MMGDLPFEKVPLGSTQVTRHVTQTSEIPPSLELIPSISSTGLRQTNGTSRLTLSECLPGLEFSVLHNHLRTGFGPTSRRVSLLPFTFRKTQ